LSRFAAERSASTPASSQRFQVLAVRSATVASGVWATIFENLRLQRLLLLQERLDALLEEAGQQALHALP